MDSKAAEDIKGNQGKKKKKSLGMEMRKVKEKQPRGMNSVPALVCVPPKGKVCHASINRNILGTRRTLGVISILRNPEP